MRATVFWVIFFTTHFAFAQSCPPTIPAAPTCTNGCVANTAINNDNLNTGFRRCHISGTSNFGVYSLNGGTLVVTGGNLNINNFDIGGTGSTILVTGGTLTISWRNLNSLGNLRVCGGTVNITGNNYNNGFNYNVASGATLNFNTTFNANGNLTITNRGTVNFNGNGTYGLNNSNNFIDNAGTIVGTNADWALGSNSTIINNTGSITIRDLALNNGNSVNMGDGAALSIRNLASNNQTNSFCVVNAGCANFNVSGSAQMNNPLTSSSGVRYCGPTPSGPGGIGLATVSCDRCNVPLPLTWLYFKAKTIQDGILLQWATNEEFNTAHFEVEHSKNGLDYQVIAEVKTRNLRTRNEYNHTHTNITPSDNYYRIKQVDLDKQFTYSRIVFVSTNDRVDGEQGLLTNIFPNPVSDQLVLSAKRNLGAKVACQLLDLQGRLHCTHQLDGLAPEATLSLPKLPAGLYILHVTSTHFAEKHKVYIQP
ncbi:MAG: T9SS type A sorting domain-containing protein [Bernardetiaceae bacterium]|jgi:hypothetical protein|nr:T9SS type A sorting domain-containing protein [Bernardetiaceae bacterium]